MIKSLNTPSEYSLIPSMSGFYDLEIRLQSVVSSLVCSDESFTILPFQCSYCTLLPLIILSTDRGVFQHYLWRRLPRQLDRGHNTGSKRNQKKLFLMIVPDLRWRWSPVLTVVLTVLSVEQLHHPTLWSSIGDNVSRYSTKIFIKYKNNF